MVNQLYYLSKLCYDELYNVIKYMQNNYVTCPSGCFCVTKVQVNGHLLL